MKKQLKVKLQDEGNGNMAGSDMLANHEQHVHEELSTGVERVVRQLNNIPEEDQSVFLSVRLQVIDAFCSTMDQYGRIDSRTLDSASDEAGRDRMQTKKLLEKVLVDSNAPSEKIEKYTNMICEEYSHFLKSSAEEYYSDWRKHDTCEAIKKEVYSMQRESSIQNKSASSVIEPPALAVTPELAKLANSLMKRKQHQSVASRAEENILE